METNKNCVLTINGGSSSIKFALFTLDVNLTHLLKGAIENIGTKEATLNFTIVAENSTGSVPVDSSDSEGAIKFLIDWLHRQITVDAVKAIGHRIVHGMQHTQPEKITPLLLQELKQLIHYDPDHLPAEIKLIEAFQQRFKTAVHVACFDTSFHSSMPLVAKLLAIPRKYFAMGIQRYGFHGLSYAYLMDQLNTIAGNQIFNGKIILAHLGSGASMAAINKGKSVDTSMGFTPAAGLLMSTRAGDLDPGVAWYLMQHEKLDATQFNDLVNHQSGLLGIAETTSNMKDLLLAQHTDNRAAEAVELFCYQAKKYIGAYAAALGGLNTLVFSGGIGEHAPEVRVRICEGLQFLGIEIDADKNENNEAVISADNSKVTVRVIKTNEELMIAKLTCNSINTGS